MIGQLTWLNITKHVNLIKLGAVKLANSTSPFKFHQAKFSQQVGLENDKMCFSKRVYNLI